MLWFILVLFVFGLFFGAIARLLVPGRDPMGCLGTWALGVGGSFVGGFLGYVVFGTDLDDGPIQMGGIIGSILGAVVLLLIARAMGDRGTRRGRRR